MSIFRQKERDIANPLETEIRDGAAQRTTTHIICDILVGAGIEQQPHTVCATIASGMYQRRVSSLEAQGSRSDAVNNSRVE
jgi:hypothetical protein